MGNLGHGTCRTTALYISQELQTCKEKVLLLNRLEETRSLDPSEFIRHQRFRERAFFISTVIKMRWSQRRDFKISRKEIIGPGFFYSFASSRLRKNAVHALKINGVYGEEGIP